GKTGALIRRQVEDSFHPFRIGAIEALKGVLQVRNAATCSNRRPTFLETIEHESKVHGCRGARTFGDYGAQALESLGFRRSKCIPRIGSLARLNENEGWILGEHLCIPCLPSFLCKGLEHRSRDLDLEHDGIGQMLCFWNSSHLRD